MDVPKVELPCDSRSVFQGDATFHFLIESARQRTLVQVYSVDLHHAAAHGHEKQPPFFSWLCFLTAPIPVSSVMETGIGTVGKHNQLRKGGCYSPTNALMWRIDKADGGTRREEDHLWRLQTRL